MKKFSFPVFDHEGQLVDEKFIDAENQRDAYYLLIEEFLGIKLLPEQTEEVLRNLVVGNYIFDIVTCDEVLK